MSAAIMLVAASESLPFNYVFFFHFQSAFFELQMVKLDLQENAFCKFPEVFFMVILKVECIWIHQHNIQSITSIYWSLL